MNLRVLVLALLGLYGSEVMAEPQPGAGKVAAPESRSKKRTLSGPKRRSALPAKAPKARPKATRKAIRKSKKRRKVPLFESVTITRRAPEDPFQSPRSVSVLTKAQLDDRRPRTTPEALMEVPGVFVQKTNHAGGAPIIRGGVGPQILILVDGVRLNTSTFRSGPNQYLNLVNPWSIRQLEVLRGAGSLAYGSYSIGGVLNIRSMGPLMSYDREFRGGVELTGRFSSADAERSGHAALQGSIAGVGLIASVSYGSFGDLRPGAVTFNNQTRYIQMPSRTFAYHRDGFGDLVINPATGGQIFSSYQNLFVDAKLQWRIATGLTLEALYQRGMLFDSGRSDQLGATGSYRIYNNARDLGYLRLRGNLPALRTRWQLTLSGQWQAESVHRERFNITGNDFALSRINDNIDDVGVFGVAFDGETRFADWFRISYGVDMYHDRVFSSATEKRGDQPTKDALPSFPEGGQYTTLGGFVSGELRAYSWAPDSGLFVHGGLRLNGFFAYAAARTDIDEVKFQQFGYAPFGSLQLRIRRAFNVSVTFHQGFRAPNLQESAFLGDAGNNFEVPNPDLRPEVARTIEVTARGRIGRRFSGFVTGYSSFWSDLIVSERATYQGESTVGGKDVARRVNTSDARVLGVEAGASVRIWRGLVLSGSLAWTQGREFDAAGQDAPLSRIPPLFGRASLRYGFHRYAFVEVYTLFAGAQTEISSRDAADPRVPVMDPAVPERVFDGTPGWATLNLRGGLRFPQLFRVWFTIENLLDARYKYHNSGVYAPGFNARLTLSFFL